MSTNYLGIPKNENEWLKYKGHCTIFCGEKIDKDNLYPEYGDKWILEPENITTEKLIKGLKSVGVKVHDIIFTKEFLNDGLRICECVCHYNKSYEVYNSEFFIEGLSSSEYNTSLEFYFSELL